MFLRSLILTCSLVALSGGTFSHQALAAMDNEVFSATASRRADFIRLQWATRLTGGERESNLKALAMDPKTPGDIRFGAATGLLGEARFAALRSLAGDNTVGVVVRAQAQDALQRMGRYSVRIKE